jgi:hypothetical protein
VITRNAARPGAVAPAHVVVETPAQLAARHAQEARQLAADQAKAREALEVRHREELAKPPAGMTQKALETRQEAEHQAQRTNESREKQVLAARQAREREGHGRGTP